MANPNKDEFLEDDEQDEMARRSIFSAGWFRALLVLTVLAIVVVVSLPYLLNWLEPTLAPPAKTQAKNGATAPTPGPAPASPPASSPAPTLIQAPAASGPPAKAESPAPPAPSARTETPKPALAPVPAAPSPAGRPLGTAPRAAVPAPATPAAKPVAAAQAETSKGMSAPTRSGAAEGGSPDGYWVQVGAFLEEKNAEALAKQLRGENFRVQVSLVTRGGASAPAMATGGQNQLFITGGATPDAVNAALKGKGTAQADKGGVAVNPPFDLETAMSLSSSLKKDGFKVVIRRAKAAAPKPAGGGPTYHVVRVGGYPDRTKAQQARLELEAKEHPGFLTQGAAR